MRVISTLRVYRYCPPESHPPGLSVYAQSTRKNATCYHPIPGVYMATAIKLICPTGWSFVVSHANAALHVRL